MSKAKNASANNNDLPPQLTRLGQVRRIVHEMEAEYGRATEKFSWLEREALVNRISSALRLSPRSVARYVAALRTPPEVQQALEEGRLKLIEAQRIAGFSQSVQAAIARRLAAGERGSDVLCDFLPADGDDETRRAFVRFYSALSRELPQLADRLDAIPLRPLCRWAGLLTKARDLLVAMIARAEATRDHEAVTNDAISKFCVDEKERPTNP